MSYAAEQEGAIWHLIRKDDEDSDMPEEVVTSFKVFFARETYLRSLKKPCELSTKNYGPFKVHIGLCCSWNFHSLCTDQARKSSTSGRAPQSRPSVTPFTMILSRISPSYTLYLEGQWAIVSLKKASIPCLKNGQPSMLWIDTSLWKQQHADEYGSRPWAERAGSPFYHSTTKRPGRAHGRDPAAKRPVSREERKL